MNKKLATLAMFGLLATLLLSCSLFAKAEISFSLTDAPVDSSAISAVNITVSSIAVNESQDKNLGDTHSSWKTLSISPAKTLNLLDLQNGVSAALGNLPITGGTRINQIRLGVDKVVVVENGTEKTATLPSATGFKIVNSFTVPYSGTIGITIDFDVRKSLVANNNGYQLKPAIRAIVENEAGKISGTADAYALVYAYTASSWNQATETTANSDGLKFSGAYSSTKANVSGSYTLAFLDPGAYILVAVKADDESILKVSQSITVEAGKTAAAGTVLKN